MIEQIKKKIKEAEDCERVAAKDKNLPLEKFYRGTVVGLKWALEIINSNSK